MHPNFYTIKQAARKAKTSVSTLRRLDERGVFPARRSPANYRIYTIQDIYGLQSILRNRHLWDKRIIPPPSKPQVNIMGEYNTAIANLQKER